MKKHIRFLALILAMLASLTACSTRGTVTGDNSSWKNVWTYRTQSTLSDVGYYYFVGSSIWFADLQSGITVPLCNKAGCSHKDSSCDVYIPYTSRIFWSGDSLYSIEMENHGTFLYRRDATGAARVKVAKLGTKYTEDEKRLTIKYFGCAGDYLYYSADVSGMVRNEETGSTQFVDEVQYISRVNMKTGRETCIFEDPVEASYDYVELLAVREDGILFYHLDATDVRREDEGFREILNADPVEIKFWNAGTGEITTMLKTTRGDFTQGICVTGGKLCYTTSIEKENGKRATGVAAYDLDTGKKELLFEGAGSFLGKGYLMRSVSGDNQRIVYELASGKEYLCDLFDGPVMLQISADHGVVVAVHVLGEGGSATESRYYFVSREAMTDGIQEGDLLHLYTDNYTN